ncbi:hypothetical protein SJAV_08140 [Sulfurisphaera javensis]|uniref:Uncharacterized protein n=2 Tax=Sulfurisphaera javensis TaxID=2049879 RepID=A0AAT9GQ09_9CREN
MLSSSMYVYPNVPTFTFVNATYHSKYISFIGIEYENRQGQPLEEVPQSIYQMWINYGNGSIPFIIYGYYYQVGTTIDPELLAGKNWTYVVSQLHNSNSLIYKEIYAQANLITKIICQIDGNKPFNVCSHFIIGNTTSNLSFYQKSNAEYYSTLIVLLSEDLKNK